MRIPLETQPELLEEKSSIFIVAPQMGSVHTHAGNLVDCADREGEEVKIDTSR